MKKVYVSENGGSNSRGWPLGRWKDRVKEYMCERGATSWGGLNKHGMNVWIGTGGGYSTMATTLERHSQRERGIRTIDRRLTRYR